MQETRLLILTGGHKHAITESINVGDVAQLENLIQTIQLHLDNCTYRVIAHSTNDSPAIQNIPYSYHLINFLHPRWKFPVLQYLYLAFRALELVTLALACNTCKWLRSYILKRTTALREITEHDAIVISGSGTLNDSYIHGTAFIWSLTAFIASILKVPTVFIGQQIGPLKTYTSRLIVGIAIRRSSFVGVRDKASHALALALGCKPTIVQFTGDEGQYILPVTNDLNQSIDPPREKRYISVHFRIDKNCPFEKSTEEFANLINLISTQLDANILLIPFSYGNKECDLVDCIKIASLLKNEVRIVGHFINSGAHKQAIANSIAAIGVANHFCVFAASVNVPTLGIYGSSYMKQKLKGVELEHEHVLTADVSELKNSKQLTENFVHHCARFQQRRQNTKLPAFHKPNGYYRWLSLINRNHA